MRGALFTLTCAESLLSPDCLKDLSTALAVCFPPKRHERCFGSLLSCDTTRAHIGREFPASCATVPLPSGSKSGEFRGAYRAPSNCLHHEAVVSLLAKIRAVFVPKGSTNKLLGAMLILANQFDFRGRLDRTVRMFPVPLLPLWTCMPFLCQLLSLQKDCAVVCAEFRAPCSAVMTRMIGFRLAFQIAEGIIEAVVIDMMDDTASRNFAVGLLPNLHVKRLNAFFAVRYVGMKIGSITPSRGVRVSVELNSAKLNNLSPHRRSDKGFHP